MTKCYDIEKPVLRLENHITIEAGNIDGVIRISQGTRFIKITATVLEYMIKSNNKENVWDVNDRILSTI